MLERELENLWAIALLSGAVFTQVWVSFVLPCACFKLVAEKRSTDSAMPFLFYLFG